MPDPSRFAFLAGTAEYAGFSGYDLPSVRDDLATMRRVFADELGYTIIGGEPLLNPTSAELRLALSDWFVADERSGDDIVAIYYSGHGLVAHRTHYLVTRDSRLRQLPATAVAAGELALHFLPDSADGTTPIRPSGVLVIVDTCYAGHGSVDVLAMAGELHVAAAGDTTVFAIACSRPRQEAEQGAFAGAFESAVRNESGKLGGTQQAYLYPIDVVDALNEHFDALGQAQRAEIGSVRATNKLGFLPNRVHADQVPPGLEVAVQQAVLIGSVESTWNPAADVIELAAIQDSSFTGREAALDALRAWLVAEPDGSMRVVTGAPGSGKSRLLRQLIGGGSAVDVGIRASGRTTAELARRIGVALQAATDPDGLVAALGARESRSVIVVDGLDEGAEPLASAEWLARLARTVPTLHVLVGTRPGLLDELGARDDEIIDLDSEPWFEPGDVAAAVTQQLVHEQGSPYRDDEPLAAAVADVVAARAGTSFLLAGLIARDLATADAASTPADVPEAIRDVRDALRRDLERFGDDRRRVEDLLTPLAYARGKGLPWTTVWPTIASALSERPYGDDDVQWLLEHAGSYLVEDVADNRSVYRLSHEELARTLRTGDDVDVHGVFTACLLASVPNGVDGRRAWDRADPYVVRHLATHARHAGALAELSRDVAFLAIAEPQRLLAALDEAGERAIAQIVRLGLPRCPEAPVPVRAAYLELVAHQQAHADLAATLDAGFLDPPWRCRWARWAPSSPHRIIPTPHGRARAHPVIEVDGRLVIYSGGADGSIRRWDLLSGEELGPPLVTQQPTIVALAPVIDRRAVLLAAQSWRTREISEVVVCHGDDGSVVAGPFPGERSPAWVRLRGGLQLVTLRGDEVRIRRRSAMADVDEAFSPGDGVRCMTAAVLDGKLLVACGHEDGTISLTEWARGKRKTRRLRGGERPTTAIAVAESGRLYARSEDRRLRCWRVATGRRLGKDLVGHYYEPVLATLGGREVVVVHNGLAIEVFDATTRSVVARLHGHNAVSYSLAAHGSWVIANDAGMLRVWDLAETPSLDAPAGQDTVRAIIEGADDQGTLAGEGSTVVAVDEHGASRRLAPTPDRVVGLALLRAPDRDLLAATMWKGRIGAWSLTRDGAVQRLGTGRAPDRDEQLTDLVVRQAEREAQIVTAGRNRPGHLRTWNAETVVETGAAREISDTFVDAMALVEVAGQLLVAAAVPTGLELWDARGTKLWARAFDTGRGGAIARGHLTAGYVVAGARAPVSPNPGEIVVWSVEGRQLAALESGAAEVERLALGILNGRDVVAAAHGTRVRVWALDGQLLADVDLDASVHALLVRSADLQVGTSKGHVSLDLPAARRHALPSAP